MKVKCITNSGPWGEDIPKNTIPIKGRMYTVKKIIEDYNVHLANTRNDTWYVLEETGIMYQHSSLFEIISIEDEALCNLLVKYHKEFNSIKVLNKILTKNK
jgi:hypothetical protein